MVLENEKYGLSHLDVIGLQNMDKIFQSNPPIGIIIRLESFILVKWEQFVRYVLHSNGIKSLRGQTQKSWLMLYHLYWAMLYWLYWTIIYWLYPHTLAAKPPTASLASPKLPLCPP